MGRMGSTLKEKLPEILIEGAFVVLAILLALAADEWREDRENAELARRAIDGLVSELRANRNSLADTHDANAAAFDALRAAAVDTVPPESLGIEYQYTLLSDAAWQTAQVTRAISYMDYEVVQDISRHYGLQSFFQEAQRRLVDRLSGVSEIVDESPERVAQIILGPYTVVMDAETGLVASLDSMIVVMERR